MEIGGAVLVCAAGVAIARMIGRPDDRASHVGLRSGPADRVVPVLDDPEACPHCGADDMGFRYDEEVDSAGRAIEVMGCQRCGWKQPLPPGLIGSHVGSARRPAGGDHLLRPRAG